MGIASLIIGIFALIFACIPAINWLGGILGVIGIVLGAIGKAKKAKCAVGGLVCSIIAAVLGLTFWIACVACAAAVA